MTLYKTPAQSLENSGNDTISVERARAPKGHRTINIEKTKFMFLMSIISHRPILCYLQQHRLAHTDHMLNEDFIKTLQEAFPLVAQKCGNCGSKPNNYSNHGKSIVSIHHLGGKQLQNIRLNDQDRCFMVSSKEHSGHWISVIDATHLRRLAGFKSSK